MRVNLVTRTMATMLAAAALVHSDAAFAIAKLPMCWIDAATRKPVLTGPPGWSPILNPDHVSNSRGNYVKLEDGSWIDTKTGKPVLTGPPGWSPILNPDHVSNSRGNYVRVPCMPSPKPTLHSSVPLKSKSDAPITLGSHISIGIGTGGSDTRDDSQPGFVVFGQ